MAGEDPHRANWIRRQPCRACGGPGPCQLHHAESGTTYDPDEPPPTKSAGPKRGKGQRCHDKWGMSLHMRCHGHFTDHTGPFKGMDDAARAQWEHDQVAEMRRLYDAEFPNGDPALAAKASRAARPRPRPRDPTLRAREAVLEEALDWAGQRRLLPEQTQLIHDLVNDLRAKGPDSSF